MSEIERRLDRVNGPVVAVAVRVIGAAVGVVTPVALALGSTMHACAEKKTFG